ncbi:FkbM family methyltransferase [Duganella sp. PWIR1]
MSFISYAQNFEDVLLWRVLQHVPNGFYIDVGANDPELHSVTKAFYDHGWRGINVEPMPSYRAAFLEQRPRDINLNVAAGAASGSITLFDLPEVNGWASTDAGVAAAHRAHGHKVVEHTVPLLTLTEICREHVRGPVHFLKIDVEGFEADVLRGMDFAAWRPWIVVVEAIMPNSRDSNHSTWEAMLTEHGYQYAWFDGLNRYYVADEHAELAAGLQLQPNVFDEFIVHHLDKAWSRGAALEQQVDAAWQLAQQHGASLEQATARRAELELDLQRELQRHEQDRAKHAQDIEQQAQQLAQHHRQYEQQLTRLQEQHGQQLAQVVQNHEQQLTDMAHHHVLQKAEQERAHELLLAQQRNLHELETAQQQHQHGLQLAQRDHDLHQRLGQILQLQADLRQAEAQSQQFEASMHQAAAWGAEMEQRLLAVYASSSWRITAPLRTLMQRGENSLPNQFKREAHNATRSGVRWLTSRQWLRRLLLPVVARSQILRTLVARTLHTLHIGAAPAAGAADVPHQLREMPQSARKALDDLQRARQTQQN